MTSTSSKYPYFNKNKQLGSSKRAYAKGCHETKSTHAHEICIMIWGVGLLLELGKSQGIPFMINNPSCKKVFQLRLKVEDHSVEVTIELLSIILS